MGIDKKGLRKIVRNDRVFYWCVKRDEDECDRLCLVIRSEDRRFSVSYMLKQKDKEQYLVPKNPFIVVHGKEFKGLDNLGGSWERFLVPDWEEQDAITPSFVAFIIDWCFTVENVTSVDYLREILADRRIS